MTGVFETFPYAPYSDHVCAHAQLSPRPKTQDSSNYSYNQFIKTSTPQVALISSNISSSQRFNIKSCNVSKVKGFCADAWLRGDDYSLHRLTEHPSTQDQPNQAARCHNYIWTNQCQWCAATSDYLHGGFSAMGAICVEW